MTIQTHGSIAIDGSYHMAILEYLIVAYATFDMSTNLDSAVAVNLTCDVTAHVNSAVSQDTAHDTATLA